MSILRAGKSRASASGRNSCMSAFVIKVTYKNYIKLEHINKRISVLKINTDSGKFRGYSIIGVYLSCSNNANREYELDLDILNMTYRRLFREGYRPIIAGDMNADTWRMKYTNDKLL